MLNPLSTARNTRTRRALALAALLPALAGAALAGTSGAAFAASEPPTTDAKNTALVHQIYADLLNREPDPSAAGWVHVLDIAAPRRDVANAITASQEYRQRLVSAGYIDYLHRSPEPQGLAAWVGDLGQGLTVEQLGAAILGSPEAYNTAGGSDMLWVTNLYQGVLGRLPAAAETASWVAVLSRGGGRTSVAQGFVSSLEHRNTVVAGYYTKYLGRDADVGGRDGWVAALAGGARQEQIIAGFIASEEYYVLAQVPH